MDVLRPFASPPRGTVLVLTLLESALVLLVWEALSGGIFPGPLAVLKQLGVLLSDGRFYYNVLSSLGLTLKAMGISIAAAAVIAYGNVVPLLRPIVGLVVKSRFLTINGLIFAFMMASPNGSDLKTNLLLFGIIPFFTASMLGVIADIPQAEYDLCRTLRMGPWRTVWEVVVLGRLDYVLIVVQVNFAIAWSMIATVEGQSVSQGGLGALIVKSTKHLDMSLIFACLVVVMLIGWASDWGAGKLRSALFPYTR